MKKAVILYHVVNLLHLLMYAAIFLGLINLFGLGFIVTNYIKEILITYIIVYLLLNFLARNLGKGMMNPIVTNKLANWLHAGSIIIFAASFYLFHNNGPQYIYLMLASFPMDIFAVVLAFREISLKEKKSQSIDDSLFN